MKVKPNKSNSLNTKNVYQGIYLKKIVCVKKMMY